MKTYVQGKKDLPNDSDCEEYVVKVKPAFSPSGELYFEVVESRPYKRGKWHILDECANEGIYCDVCHKKVFKYDFSNTMKWRDFKYCPHCGTPMEGEEE